MAQRSKFVIQPFKHNQQMDEDYANRTWQTLHDAIHEIHRQNASGLSFEELYRNAYNMVLHKFGDKLYNGLSDTITRHLQSVAIQVADANDECFLPDLKDKWDKHKLSSIMIRDILMYMVRFGQTPASAAPAAPAPAPAPSQAQRNRVTPRSSLISHPSLQTHSPLPLLSSRLRSPPHPPSPRTARTWQRRRRRPCTSAACKSSATR